MVRKIIPVAVSLMLLVSFAFGQNHSAAPAVDAKVVGASQSHKPRPRISQEIFAPFWTLEPGWDTELQIRNNHAKEEIKVTPVLRTVEGIEVPLTAITVKPNQVAMLHLENAAPQFAGKANSFGSIVLRYSAVSHGNIYASFDDLS